MEQETTIPLPTTEELQAEIDRFEAQARKFLSGEADPDAFKRFRLKQGIYGQRQPGVQMVRIKIPFGALTSDQLRTIARISETYATGVGHVTTRQDIQLHFVKLERVPALLRELAAVGLTTRESCGNTVRNVTACPLAGVCPDELFDVTPYALATNNFFLRHPICEDLPRKFKFAFSGCHHDRAMTGIHDVGVMAAVGANGNDTLGFRITVGGGLGPSPKRPYLLEEFIPPVELLPTCEAVLRVFSRFGNRKTRSLARIKFLIEKIGFEEFYRLYAAERQLLQQSRPPALPDTLRTVTRPPRVAPVTFPAALSPAAATAGTTPDWPAWRSRNVIDQRQPGLCTVQIRLVIGDASAAGLLALAEIADRFAHSRLRTTQQQNIVFRDVEETSLPALHRARAERGLALTGAEEIADIVACPGTDSCGLGITASKGLGRVLAEQLRLEGEQDEQIRRITIKISGCPNSCAQHHIASIGFHGLAQKINGRLLPAYQLHLGGRITPGGVQFGQLFALKFPAKRIPDVVRHLLKLYRAERRQGESFLDYVDRIGKTRAQQELTPLAQATGPQIDEGLFHDWEDERDYTMAEIGAGECGSVAVNFITQHFEDSAYELAHARVLLEKNRPLDAVTRADLALVAAAKALLTMEEVEPLTYDEAMKEFDARVVASGRIAGELWSAVHTARQQRSAEPLTMERARQYVHAVGTLAGACQAYYEQIAGEPASASAQAAPLDSPGD